MQGSSRGGQLTPLVVDVKLDKNEQFFIKFFRYSIGVCNNQNKQKNNLTGRLRHYLRHCPILADAIASQLVRNGRYETVDPKSSQLVSQKVSDF